MSRKIWLKVQVITILRLNSITLEEMVEGNWKGCKFLVSYLYFTDPTRTLPTVCYLYLQGCQLKV